MTSTTLLSVTLLIAVVALLLLIALFVKELSNAKRQETCFKQQEQLLNDIADEMTENLLSLRRTLAEDNRQQMSMVTDLIKQSAQSQAVLLEQFGRQMNQQLMQLDTHMEQLRSATTNNFTTLRQDNDRQLTEIRKTVDEKLTDSLNKRLNESFALVSKRLEEVYRGLGEMQTLANGVGDLKKVLTNVKTRGIWGEMQLGALLSQVLTDEQYAENIAVVPGSTARVEFAVCLPGQDGKPTYLPIDSKFPQEDYLRLVEASNDGDAVRVAETRKALAKSIQTEAKRIASKYIAPPHTTDFAIMFLPVEGLYAEVMRDMDVVDTISREQRVVIAGPSTFVALLNALQMGFRTLAIEKRSSEVWQLLGTVKTDFGRFAGILEKTRQRLAQASETIDDAYRSSRDIERHLLSVEKDQKIP